jgi:hypothetical protein
MPLLVCSLIEGLRMLMEKGLKIIGISPIEWIMGSVYMALCKTVNVGVFGSCLHMVLVTNVLIRQCTNRYSSNSFQIQGFKISRI